MKGKADKKRADGGLVEHDCILVIVMCAAKTIMGIYDGVKAGILSAVKQGSPITLREVCECRSADVVQRELASDIVVTQAPPQGRLGMVHLARVSYVEHFPCAVAEMTVYPFGLVVVDDMPPIVAAITHAMYNEGVMAGKATVQRMVNEWEAQHAEDQQKHCCGSDDCAGCGQ